MVNEFRFQPFLVRQIRSDTAMANAQKMKSRRSVMTAMSDQAPLSCSAMSQLRSVNELPANALRRYSR
jgi:hypothetical protein